MFTWGICFLSWIRDPNSTKTYLERVYFRDGLLTTILLVVVREEDNVLAHSLNIRVVLYEFVVFQFGVQDRSVKKYQG